MAQREYKNRQKNKRKHIRFTEEVKQYVECFAKDFSPEQIAGRAALEGRGCVNHEHIYQYVWKDKKEGGNLLHTHLRHKECKFRKRGNTKNSRGIIKNWVDISQRPEIVDRKERLGDLEIDTMIG